MTTIINSVTANFISSHPSGALYDGMAAIAVIILLILLIEKVLFDANEGRPIKFKTQALSIVILPFLFVTAVIVCLRMAQILHFL